MRVLVTGSSGFLGQHLCNALEEYCHDVIEYDLADGFDIMDEEGLVRVMLEHDVDDVVHLAAIADLYIAKAHPEHAVTINIEGTRRVLSACERLGIPMLFASTCCAYGNNGVHPSPENAPLAPGEIYAETKVIAEELVSQGTGGHTIMRLATFYGPGQRCSLATSVFLERAANGQPIIIHGNGEQTRTFTHVEDIVSGIICILQSTVRPKVVNISTDESNSVNDLASICMRLTQDVEVLHVEDRPGQIFHEEIDNRVLRSLGWTPVHSLYLGLSTCINALHRSSGFANVNEGVLAG
jgi:nucleoside-diphosphate-sugar epimerase